MSGAGEGERAAPRGPRRPGGAIRLGLRRAPSLTAFDLLRLRSRPVIVSRPEERRKGEETAAGAATTGGRPA